MFWNEVFLQAEWHSLAMLNYETEPSLIVPFIPAGTELDSWHGRFFVSLVGFPLVSIVWFIRRGILFFPKRIRN